MEVRRRRSLGDRSSLRFLMRYVIIWIVIVTPVHTPHKIAGRSWVKK
jgi:hypothetical protein